MGDWKNGKSVVYEDRHGNTRCGACCSPLWCNDTGDMPDTCPQCGAPLDYSPYNAEHNANGSIFVVAMNYFGDLPELAARLGASIVDGTLCFTGLNGSQVSALMEANGIDCNYAYTPEETSSFDD